MTPYIHQRRASFASHFPLLKPRLRGVGRLDVQLATAPASNSTSTSTWKQQLLRGVLSLVMVVGLGFAAVILVPKLYYAISPVEVIPVVASETGTPLGGEFSQGASPSAESTQTQPAYQPPLDETLPMGKWITIPRIGVKTELLETADSEEALQKGVWLVPEYGDPGDRSKPMIAVAHRYGYKQWWESDYWKYHSFYLLPDLEPGDRVEVISDQRKWVYEIYAGEEGDAITDYQADLILYTCKYLNSPIRHFRYARLIDPTKDTQATL